MKAYSATLNVFGGVGPIPEGMDATAALRNLELAARHEKIKERVLAQAAAFQEKQGYRPPYWELVRMANQARKEAKASAKEVSRTGRQRPVPFVGSHEIEDLHPSRTTREVSDE